MSGLHSGLTAVDGVAEITVEAARPFCCPDVGLPRSAFGYLGGGFGPYRLCNGCGLVFGKVSARDGNQGSDLPEPMREVAS